MKKKTDVKFSETEQKIKELFLKTNKFSYKDKEYTVIKCDKPIPQRSKDGGKGECKTDVYVLAKDGNGCYKEFKISVKQENADFLENKIKLERAKEILGENAQDIIERSILKIKKSFEEDCFVNFTKCNNTDASSIKMGWKFEFMNKLSGHKSGEMDLTEQQKVDIYAGTNLCMEKKNSIVCNEVIPNSGIANYILIVDTKSHDLDYYLNRMQPIDNNYTKNKKIYFACKALNYRQNKEGEKKLDENRPLAVYVDWSYDKDDKLQGKLVFDKPLSVKGNDIGNNIKRILSRLNIDKNNFSELKQYLHKDVKYI